MNISHPQRTLAEPSVLVQGVGLHSGRMISMRLLPAKDDSGICFHRKLDDDSVVTIPIRATNVSDTLLATRLSVANAEVSTVEHLLCALCICGVDNAVIEIDGPEVPIMDGSARPFILVIQDTGLIEQEQPKKYIKLKKNINVFLPDEPERCVSFEPTDEVSWDVNIDFNDPVIRNTKQSLKHNFKNYDQLVKQVSTARTFGFVHELDYLRANQRALGGSLDNAVVLDGKTILNKGGLRNSDEFVAHKLLDAIGDCYIEGKLVIAKYTATMPGHKLNNLLMRKMLSDSDAWHEVSATQYESKLLPDYGPLQATVLG